LSSLQNEATSSGFGKSGKIYDMQMELLKSITQLIFLENSIPYSNIKMVMIMTYVYM